MNHNKQTATELVTEINKLQVGLQMFGVLAEDLDCHNNQIRTLQSEVHAAMADANRKLIEARAALNEFLGQ